MKLYYAAPSPFVRKVVAAAIEAGLDDRIERVTVNTTPVAPDAQLGPVNPLSKLPTLVTDDGDALYDSAVICGYLDELSGGKLIPAEGAARWAVLRDEALADGVCDAAVISRYEVAIRPEEKQWDGWLDAQRVKMEGALDQMERTVGGYGNAVHLGAIAFGCALGYLDFRFGDLTWRDGRPSLAGWFETFAQRPSMTATAPPE